MALFSERYGYTKPSEVLIREKMTKEIENALCSSFDVLEENLRRGNYANSTKIYKDMELFLWTDFLNQRYNDFFTDYGGHMIIATQVLRDSRYEWFRKLNMVELSVKWLFAIGEKDPLLIKLTNAFTSRINHEFERLNYAYRFVEREIVEISSKEEIVAIEKAIKNSENNIRLHLQSALSLLDEIENSGISIPKVLKLGFDKLYGYTNNKDTGIRHALMDNDGTYIPSSSEAIFMIVSCSAFINYLNAKKSQ